MRQAQSLAMLPAPPLAHLVDALGGPTKVARLLDIERSGVSQAISPQRPSLAQHHLRRLATLAPAHLAPELHHLADLATLIEDAANRSPSGTISVPYMPGTLSATLTLLAATHHGNDTTLRAAAIRALSTT